MQHRAFISTRLSSFECEAALWSFYEARGYRLESSENGQLDLVKPARLFAAMSWRVEDLEIRLQLRFAEREGGAEEASMITLLYEPRSTMRLFSHMDLLYFDTEIETLEEALNGGQEAALGEALDEVRRPVAVALLFNVVTSAALATAACTVIGLGLVATILISLGVALINFVSILGFADILIQGMDQLSDLRRRRSARD